eukprot:1137256-Pelagomonas_calceolata.AAC.1
MPNPFLLLFPPAQTMCHAAGMAPNRGPAQPSAHKAWAMVGGGTAANLCKNTSGEAVTSHTLLGLSCPRRQEQLRNPFLSKTKAGRLDFQNFSREQSQAQSACQLRKAMPSSLP